MSVPIDRAATLRNAEKLLRQGKLDQAIAEYRRVVDEHPRDWNTGNILGDLYLRANQTDHATELFVRSADVLIAEGFLPKAGALYRKILKLKPDDEYALSQAADIAAKQGILVDARKFLNAIGDRQRARGDQQGVLKTTIRLAALDPADYDQRMAGARARFELGDHAAAVKDLQSMARELVEAGRAPEALDALREAGRFDATNLDVTAQLAETLSAAGSTGSDDEAQALVAQLADAAVSRGDWNAAAASLEEFLDRAPANIPALMRLVEICVDGGLDDRIDRAQAQLADAHIARGSAADARYIAEDLALRDPSDTVRRARWRQVLELSGEFDPDAIIEERLSAAAAGAEEHTEAIAPPPEATPAVSEVTPAPQTVVPPAAMPTLPAPPTATARAQNVEVDLSVILDNIRRTDLSALPNDLDSVFAQMREEASRRLEMDEGEQDFQRAMAFYHAGKIDEALPALERASRAAHHRFDAALALGRICRSRGQAWPAIEWFERAAQAPASSVDEGHRLLLELADLLESAGETARALAICLELQADAGSFEDVAARVERLVKVQALG